jgi:hypothetical protein
MKFVYTESSQLYFNFLQAGPNTKVGSGTTVPNNHGGPFVSSFGHCPKVERQE